MEFCDITGYSKIIDAYRYVMILKQQGCNYHHLNIIKPMIYGNDLDFNSYMDGHMGSISLLMHFIKGANRWNVLSMFHQTQQVSIFYVCVSDCLNFVCVRECHITLR